MTPRLMFVCLGGLAGAGALVCCDLGDGLEDEDLVEEDRTKEDLDEKLEAPPAGDAVTRLASEAEPQTETETPETEAVPIH